MPNTFFGVGGNFVGVASLPWLQAWL